MLVKSLLVGLLRIYRERGRRRKWGGESGGEGKNLGSVEIRTTRGAGN